MGRRVAGDAPGRRSGAAVHHSLRYVRAGVLAVMELVEVSALVTRAEAAEIAKMAEMMGCKFAVMAGAMLRQAVVRGEGGA